MRLKLIANNTTVERRFSSWIGGSILASLVSLSTLQNSLRFLFNLNVSLKILNLVKRLNLHFENEKGIDEIKWFNEEFVCRKFIH